MIEIKSFGYYEKRIQTEYVIDHCGIDLEKFGEVKNRLEYKVNLDSEPFINFEKLKTELNGLTDFIVKKSLKPIWYKINVIDQAINEYVGIGFLNNEKSWLNFIIQYLKNDRAEQSGDTILILFDLNFEWCICFTLSQDNSNLIIEQYKKTAHNNV